MAMYRMEFDDDGSIKLFQPYTLIKGGGWSTNGVAAMRDLKLPHHAAVTVNGTTIQPVSGYKWPFADKLRLYSHHRSGLLAGIKKLSDQKWSFEFEPAIINYISYYYYDGQSNIWDITNSLGATVREQLEHTHAITISTGCSYGQVVWNEVITPATASQYYFPAQSIYDKVNAWFNTHPSESPGAVRLSGDGSVSAAQVAAAIASFFIT